MADIPYGVDNPTGYKPDKPLSRREQTGTEHKPPSAFIQDQETMNYLIQRWRKYAHDEARDYHRQSFYGSQFEEEKFDMSPIGIDGDYYIDRRITLVNQEVGGIFKESAKRMHGVDFFEETQTAVEAKRASGDTNPVRVLVTGSDLGFFNDELRTKFGEDIEVQGTTLELSRARMVKRRLFELIRQDKMHGQVSPELREYLSKALKETIDPRDSKWRSILQMTSAEPEFDKIIDTCGELLYSYDEARPEIFELTFRACIQKLNPGGKLYIAELPIEVQRYIEEHCKEQGLSLEKHEYVNRHDWLQTNFVITKPHK